jgi:membrane protease FtsH catalytic subunit (EC 3.4.24.-)
VRDLVNDAFNRAQDILQRERAVLEEGARQLLAKETLSEADLKALFAPLAAAQTQA